MLIYDRVLSRSEVNVLENMWRQKVRDSVYKSRHILLKRLVAHLPLPEEIWRCIFSMNDTLPCTVTDVRCVGRCAQGELYELDERT